MPDDTDDMQIMDLASARAMTEPRSAVEAASNPAHGGGVAVIRPADIVDPPNPYALPGPMVMGADGRMWAGKMGPTPDANGVVPPIPKRQDPISPAPRTISSGIARLKALVERAAPVLDDFATLAAALDGQDGTKAGLTGEGSTEKRGTPGALHDAVSLAESFVDRVSDLVKRAKAAHG